MNKYPIYVISKDRHDCCYTADFLIKDGVPFKLVDKDDRFKFKYPTKEIINQRNFLIYIHKNQNVYDL